MNKLLLLAALLLPCAAQAQVTIIPGQRTSIPVNGTIAAGNTFQQILPADLNRTGCLIQNQSTHTMYFYAGPTASATTANSIQITAGNSFSCANPGGTIVITDNIAATTSTTSDAFAGFYQH